MKKLCFILLLLIHAIHGRSQFDIDSLKEVLAKEKTDSVNIGNWLKKTGTLSTPETEPLLVICNWGLENAKKNRK